MEWLKKHADSMAVIAIVVSAIYIQTQHIEKRFAEIEKELAVIRTALVIKGILPDSLAKKAE